MKMYNVDLEWFGGMLLMLLVLMLVTAMILPAPLAGLHSMESRTHCSKQAAVAGKGGCQRDRLRLDRDED